MAQPVTSRVTLTYCWMPKPRDDAAPILLDSALIEVEIAIGRFWWLSVKAHWWQWRQWHAARRMRAPCMAQTPTRLAPHTAHRNSSGTCHRRHRHPLRIGVEMDADYQNALLVLVV